MSNTSKLLPQDGLKVVISKDYKGNLFLNVLMPNGEELPFIRSCRVESNYKGSPVTVATIELLVDISEIDKYVKPDATQSFVSFMDKFQGK